MKGENVLFNQLPGKRLKSDPNLELVETPLVKPYEEYNNHYLTEGFTQKALQYLRKMGNSNRSIMLLNNSSRASAFFIFR